MNGKSIIKLENRKVSGEDSITGEVLQASDRKFLQSFLALWKKTEQEREATGEEAS